MKVNQCEACLKDGGDCCSGCGQQCDCEQCKSFRQIMEEAMQDFNDYEEATHER